MNMQVSSTDGIDTSMTEDPNGSRTTESTEHSRHHCQLNDASTCTNKEEQAPRTEHPSRQTLIGRGSYTFMFGFVDPGE
nr:unnamed protein product [Fasciola hepatica]